MGGGGGFWANNRSANLMEVGGKDTPVMNAMSNILNNAPGFFIPPLGLLLKRLTGSWVPLFASCGGINFAMCLLFSRFSSLDSARDTLAAADPPRPPTEPAPSH